MIRLIGILVGLGFTSAVLWAFGVGAYTFATEPAEETAEHAFHLHPKDVSFPSDGPFGKFDRRELQRGYQVYKEVCAACHGLHLVAFRDLEALGYSEAQVKAAAAEWTVPGIDPNTGEATTRPGVPTDYFPSPYANDTAARAANNNAIPPDLSLITKARHDGGAYLYSLLTGYSEMPAEMAAEFPEFSTPTGLYFNRYFPNLNLAMPPPLSEGQVTYADGTEATVEQMSKDVSAFLIWAAEPTLEKRLQTGWAVIGFLLFATVLAWFAKQQVWAPLKPKKKA
ncbi:MAG: cytochrome c1 [Sphingomonadales bacterium 32-68-7]|nr:MAG: cytochrome c1 [Sphingomonadales bacterium 12-68-11]OYX08588.1 MAG: cytochrome c1 [Sphingomonadales bacterium 32-68-7]